MGVKVLVAGNCSRVRKGGFIVVVFMVVVVVDF